MKGVSRRGFSVVGGQNILKDKFRFESVSDAVIRVKIGERIPGSPVGNENSPAV